MRIARLFFATAAIASTFAVTQTAKANTLDACGDFFFDPAGDVTCEVVLEGGCEAKCEPLAFEVECSAELQLGCQGGCNLDIEVGCDVECQGGCVTECEGGSFDCEASCSGGCEASCDSECSSSGNSTECHASCSANCSAECSASCNVELPSCETQCEASCQGQCKAEANASCQIECQADGYIDCEANLQGGCEVACKEPSGAVFCDGQWVNTDDLDSCVDQIQSYFDIEVSGYAEANCSGNTCSAEAGVSAGCSAAPSAPDTNIGFLMMGLVTAGVAAARRRNRR